MEEEMDESSHALANRSHLDSRRMCDNSSNLKIEAWLSPLSDHFPTPRGFHFLAAPILPSSPSSASGGESTSPTASSNPWNRASVGTDVTEFDDLYDASDDEDARRIPPRSSSLKGQNATGNSRRASGSRKSLPPLVIPSTRPSRENSPDKWSAGRKMLTSPVPPTPPTKVELSPEVMSFLHAQQAQEVPTISAPPSLDGSLSSEQMAAMSAPPTPIIGDKTDDADEDWSGVQLQPGALATLQALSGADEAFDEDHEEQVIELPHEPASEMRQQPPRLVTSFQPRLPHRLELTPDSHRRSLADLTRLDIPSPGGFFSALSPRTRNTWHLPSRSPSEAAPPTSTTAEQFYRCPWNIPNAPPVPRPWTVLAHEEFYQGIAISTSPVEQVVEVKQDAIMDEDDVPTARPILPTEPSTLSVAAAEPTSPDGEDVPTEIVKEYDAQYALEQQEVALSHLDRTEKWLMAQKAYLKGVIDDEAEEQADEALATIHEMPEEEPAATAATAATTATAEPEESTPPKKKTVRFSEVVSTTEVPCKLPSKTLWQESAYYRAFQDHLIRSRPHDVFVHRVPRFEALQAQRVSLRESHRNQLLGKYQLSVVPQSAKKRLSANVARGDDNLLDDPEKIKREKEQEAMTQMSMSNWHVAAVRLLNGGRLISAPVAKRLARVSRMAPGEDGVARDRARVLDLGGQATCDWAWHCAVQYPNTKIYTVTTKAIRQLSNSNIRGPSNHRQVAVDHLTRLPFSDNQFDLVSARELHNILKFVGENGEDEWESCLRECMRVLKPGGYLEFSILDSDIMNAGPLGLAMSVEFGYKLKTLGYDPTPTKMWLGRLSRAGFDQVRRAWMCLPMGERRPNKPPPPPLKDSPTGQEVKTLELEAMVTGSTDNVASVCSIVGGWSWERWLLRAEMEKVAGEVRLADTVTASAAMLEADKCLDGVPAIIEEGRNCGAGWRLLTGYARKPRTGMGFISVALEADDVAA